MFPAWVSLVLVVAVLAMIPVALKWLQRRMGGSFTAMPSVARVVSAVGVGPHQRVVTVEVGPDGARVWLTLGVTAQTITCLHTMPMPPQTATNSEPVEAHSPTSLTQEHRP